MNIRAARQTSAFGIGTAALLAASLTACSSGHSTPSAAPPSVPAAVTSSTPPVEVTAATVTAPATASQKGTTTGSTPGSAPDHVVVVIFENKEESQVQGSSDAPYFNELAKKGATYTDWTAITHPSQPNYLAMFSGSTQGVTGDECLTAGKFAGPDLGGEIIAAGKTFTGFAESMPSDGYLGCRTDLYAAKHNPWVDFHDVPAASNRTFAAFPSDFTKLPTLSFVVPNMCDDMHDCPVASGDKWLKAHMSAYADWAAAHNSLLIITWDEDDNTEKNVIPTTIVGAGVKIGAYADKVDHYSLLRTLEQFYKLPYAGASAQAKPLPGLGLATS